MSATPSNNSLKIIDFHVHVYPHLPWPAAVEPLRLRLNQLLRPLSRFQQEAQTWLRQLPSASRPVTDELGVPMVLPHLLIESDVFDLAREMEQENVVKAVIVPHPPLISNDFTFYESKRVEGLIPATFIDPETMASANDLDAFYNRGVRLFKINPLQSGVPTEAPFYKEFLDYLNKKKAILLIHTGGLSSHLFKLPKAGNIREYEHWFQHYPDIRFVAAHMNFHDPETAIELAEDYDNLYLLTSWQPAKAIQEAIKRIGHDKILFASDWPLIGNNIRTQKERLWSLHRQGVLTENELRAIFFENAQKLLSSSSN